MSAASLRICAYQGGGTHRDENLIILDRVLGEMQGSADLVVFPELFISGYNVTDFAAVDFSAETEIRNIVAKHKLFVCLGVAEVNPADDEKPFNSVVLFDRNASVIFRHQKTHLWSTEKDSFSCGNQIPDIVEIEGFKVSCIVCYEVEFAEMTRKLKLAGCDIVLVTIL